MRFLLRKKFFILPVAGVCLLLFQHWVPLARECCIALNFFTLACAALEYFLMPDPHLFAASRELPRQFFHRRGDTVRLTLSTALPLPVFISVQDRPPEQFRETDPVFEVAVSRGAREHRFTYPICPLCRGEFSFGGIGIRMTTRIGLIARQFTIPCSQSVVVYPPFPDSGEALLSRYYTLALPNRTMRVYGPGSEFHQMRAVHWKRSARSGTLITREFQPEKGQNVLLMVDGGRLMLAEYASMTKVDWALSACVSLADEALRKRDAIGLSCFSNAIERYVAPSNKINQLTKLIEATSRFQPQFIEPDYGAVFRQTYLSLKNRSIVVIFTDFFDPYLSADLYAHILLMRRRHRVICCVLTHPDMERQGFRTVRSLGEATEAAVIRENIDNRNTILRELRRCGIDIVDTAPEKLNGAVLSAYIRARWR
jgi:uncharacterized protein (DUF58 family)